LVFTIKSENCFQESEKQRRAKELQELASSRPKKNWNEAVIITEVEGPRLSTKTPDPETELEEARISIRSTAMAWQERDRATSGNRYYGSEILDPRGSTTPTPSR